VSKALGSRRVLEDVSLEVHQGDVLAIAGPGGGGKCELAEILSGRRIADGGRLTVAGKETSFGGWGLRAAVLSAPRDALVTTADTVRTNIEAGADRRGGQGPSEDWVTEVIDRFGLTDAAGVRAGDCSRGRQRVLALAKCVAGRARVTVLVDPTLGLDRPAALKVGDAINDLAAGGMAFVLVSHDPAEAEAIANRVVLLNRTVIGEGTVAELVARYAPGRFIAAVAPDQTGDLAREFERLGIGAIRVERRLGKVTGSWNGTLAQAGQVLQVIDDAGITLAGFSLHPASLADAVAGTQSS
jgi:ABC-2 type transport system ATP-binding protein